MDGMDSSTLTAAWKKAGRGMAAATERVRFPSCKRDTVDGRNPANLLRLVVYPIIYKVSTSQVVQAFFHQYFTTVNPTNHRPSWIRG